MKKIYTVVCIKANVAIPLTDKQIQHEYKSFSSSLAYLSFNQPIAASSESSADCVTLTLQGAANEAELDVEAKRLLDAMNNMDVLGRTGTPCFVVSQSKAIPS